MGIEYLIAVLQWWIEPFRSNPFMMDALIAGSIAAVTTGVVGTWVVLRGMSFFGDALAHGVLPGMAVAYVLGFNTILGALGAAFVMVICLNVITGASKLPEDATIGVLFVGFLSLAVVIMSKGVSTGGDLQRFLFGSITGITSGDLLRLAAVSSAVLVVSALMYRPLLLLTFDETQAQILKMRPRLTHMLLLVLIALAIVVSFEIVGNLLVFAFLVATPSAAIVLVKRVPVIMATAATLGVLAVYIGLLISYNYNTAASATMALVAVSLFIFALVVSRLKAFLLQFWDTRASVAS